MRTIYTAILTFGVLVAATLSDDSRWMGWSLSRLGETVVNRHSALAFNAGVFMSSLVLIMIGVIHNENGIIQTSSIKGAEAIGAI